MGVDVETTVVDPLLPVRDMEVTFIENPSIQSAGESPIFTTRDVVAGVVVVDPVLDVLPLPLPLHAVNRDARKKVKTAVAALAMNLCWEAFCRDGVMGRFIFYSSGATVWPGAAIAVELLRQHRVFVAYAFH